MTEFTSGTANCEHNAFATDVTRAPWPGGNRSLAIELNAVLVEVTGVLVTEELTGVVGDSGGGVVWGGGCTVGGGDEGGGGGGGGVVCPHTTLVPVAIQGVPDGQHQLVFIAQIVYPALQH